MYIDRTPKTTGELWQQAWMLAGKSLFYMQFCYPHEYDEQAIRVHQMCYHLAKERTAHLEDTPENRNWYHEWIEKFIEEVENQC
jgi:hypothetical protein